MFPPQVLLLPFFFFFSLLHPTTADDAIRWKECNGNATYTPNSIFSANLGRALDHLKNYTSHTSFNSTTISTVNETESITALALCRGTITSSVCQSCMDMAVLGILQQCPNKTTAQIWYDYCMIRYSNVNFLTKPDNTIVFSIWNTNDAPQPEIYGHKVRVLTQNLTAPAAVSEKRFAKGWTNMSNMLTLYGYLDCTRDISSEDCTKCLINAITGIDRCCLVKWAVWIGIPSCCVQFSLDPLFNDTNVVPEVFTDLLSSPLPPTPTPTPPQQNPNVIQSVNGDGRNGGMVVEISVGVVGAVILMVGILWMVVMKGREGKQKKTREGSRNEEKENEGEEDVEEMMRDGANMGSIYDFDVLVAATDNFSSSNWLGCGGFGTVYKGIMLTGEEIAVKKLAVGSSQGVEEFSNEVLLLLRMQHRNLIKLLGCCFQGEERMLVYEYLPNKSLDRLLFDRSKSALLNWSKRLNIMVGIARGLLYLHEDSQLKIIHRDIKASNILLDEQMTPKISDFGLAKLFPDEHSYLRTRRIAGTIGYMAPEYAIRGIMSAKIDVYSFGVLMLEIISGRKNYDLQLEEKNQQLLKLTWRLEREGRLMELVDDTIGSCPQDEVLKCIRIGLMCCQESIQERPVMSTVVLMLSNDSLTTHPLGHPGYQEDENSSIDHEDGNVSTNSSTATSMSGR